MNLTNIYDSRREDVTDLKIMDADLEFNNTQTKPRGYGVLKRPSLFILLLAASGTLIATQAPPQNSLTGVVQGTVTRDGTSEPIPGVRISVAREFTQSDMKQSVQELAGAINAGLTTDQILQRQPSPSAVASPVLHAVTDSSGHFIIKDAPVGNINITAVLDGYFSPAADMLGNVSTVVQTPAAVEAQKTVDVQLVMTPGATISGRVFNPDGKPLVNAKVKLYRKANTSAGSTLEAVIGKTTDDRGEFRIFRAAPGEYFLGATPPQNPSLSLLPSDPRQMQLTTLYPDAIDQTTANPIALHGGDDISGMDIRVRTAPLFRLSGHVVSTISAGPAARSGNTRGGAAAAPRAAVADLSLVPHDRNPLNVLGDGIQVTANTGDESFNFPNVPPGIYDLYARLPIDYGWGESNPPGKASRPWALGRTTVEIRNRDVDDVVMTVHQGVDVKGRILVDGKPMAPNIRFLLVPTGSPSDSGKNFDSIFEQVSSFRPVVSADGFFTIPVVPESNYRFAIQLGRTFIQTLATNLQVAGVAQPSGPNALPDSAYVADIRQSNRSIYDEGLDVESSEQSGPVEILISTSGGSIEGTVRDAGQKAPIATQVVLVPTESRRKNRDLFKTTIADDSGHFSMKAVPPGSYKLFAWATIQLGGYQDAEFMKKYESRGSLITVIEGAKVTADVSLIR